MEGTVKLYAEKYIALHRNAYISMQQCSEHFMFQFPNEQTRVTYLLDGISCNDVPLQASLDLVCNDTALTGKMNNFEDTAAFILPHNPMARRRTSSNKQ